MNSRLYLGTLMHARLQPTRHEFTYPVYFYAFDLSELPLLNRSLRGFSYNRFNAVALHDRDYLKDEPGSIMDKLIRVLKAQGVDRRPERVELITAARWFHYVFNPVSFYYCYAAGDEPMCIVAEVNNTFRDKHVYVLDRPLSPAGADPLRYRHAKTFHVSPFNDLTGWYDFRFSAPAAHLSVQIDLWRQDRPWIVTELRGRACPLTSGSLARTLLRYPLTAALTTPRILAEAARLYFRKRLPVFRRPEPTDPCTLRIGPSRTPSKTNAPG